MWTNNGYAFNQHRLRVPMITENKKHRDDTLKLDIPSPVTGDRKDFSNYLRLVSSLSKGEQLKQVLVIKPKDLYGDTTVLTWPMRKDVIDISLGEKFILVPVRRVSLMKAPRVYIRVMRERESVVGTWPLREEIPILLNVPEKFTCFGYIHIDSEVFEYLGLEGLKKAFAMIGSADDVSDILVQTQYPGKDKLEGLFPAETDEATFKAIGLEVLLSYDKGDLIIRGLYEKTKNKEKISARFDFRNGVGRKVIAEYPPFVFINDIGMFFAQNAPVDQDRWHKKFEDIIKDIRSHCSKEVVTIQDDNFRVIRLGYPEDDVAIFISTSFFDPGARFIANCYLLENFEMQFKTFQQRNSPIKNLSMRRVKGPNRLERLKNFIETSSPRLVACHTLNRGNVIDSALSEENIGTATDEDDKSLKGLTGMHNQVIAYLKDKLISLSPQRRSTLRILYIGFGEVYLPRKIHFIREDISKELVGVEHENIDVVGFNAKSRGSVRLNRQEDVGAQRVFTYISESLARETRGFDIVVCLYGMDSEAISIKHGHRLLKEIRKALKDGGIAILVADTIVPDLDNPMMHPKKRFEKLGFRPHALSIPENLLIDFFVLQRDDSLIQLDVLKRNNMSHKENL
ncbi:MAG: class I SAM-dependent methyltransferase [Planctomycetota bacterium]